MELAHCASVSNGALSARRVALFEMDDADAEWQDVDCVRHEAIDNRVFPLSVEQTGAR